MRRSERERENTKIFKTRTNVTDSKFSVCEGPESFHPQKFQSCQSSEDGLFTSKGAVKDETSQGSPSDSSCFLLNFGGQEVLFP